jgi:hypothetical protein
MRAAGLALLGCLASQPSRGEVYDFQIRCNGDPVGQHIVQVRERDGQTEVSVSIDLSVHIAGLEVYTYHHRSHERWRQGRLMAMESKTNDNGEDLSVDVRRDDLGRLIAATADGTRLLPDDVVPTSYWNPALLERRVLLDSQSGRLLQVSVTPISDGRYLMSGDLQLELDYRHGSWSGLHFTYIGAEVDYQKRQILSDSAP